MHKWISYLRPFSDLLGPEFGYSAFLFDGSEEIGFVNATVIIKNGVTIEMGNTVDVECVANISSSSTASFSELSISSTNGYLHKLLQQTLAQLLLQWLEHFISSFGGGPM